MNTEHHVKNKNKFFFPLYHFLSIKLGIVANVNSVSEQDTIDAIFSDADRKMFKDKQRIRAETGFSFDI